MAGYLYVTVESTLHSHCHAGWTRWSSWGSVQSDKAWCHAPCCSKPGGSHLLTLQWSMLILLVSYADMHVYLSASWLVSLIIPDCYVQTLNSGVQGTNVFIECSQLDLHPSTSLSPWFSDELQFVYRRGIVRSNDRATHFKQAGLFLVSTLRF